MDASGRIVVSAPRSGLNWLRYWIEDRYGLATGSEALSQNAAGHARCLLRSHDPLGLRAPRFWRRGKRSDAWQGIAPGAADGAKVILILRHPLEVFVRAADQNMRKFRCYESCIGFYTRATGAQRLLLRYEDLITQPQAISAALQFLELTPREGLLAPTADSIAAEWEAAGAHSRAIYASRHSSGTKTARNPLDFAFHRRNLSDRAAARVWAHLDSVLDAEGRALLDPWR